MPAAPIGVAAAGVLVSRIDACGVDGNDVLVGRIPAWPSSSDPEKRSIPTRNMAAAKMPTANRSVV
jgi:hypothetical protein